MRSGYACAYVLQDIVQLPDDLHDLLIRHASTSTPFSRHESISISIRLTPCRKKVRLYSIIPLRDCHVSVRSRTTSARYLGDVSEDVCASREM